MKPYDSCDSTTAKGYVDFKSQRGPQAKATGETMLFEADTCLTLWFWWFRSQTSPWRSVVRDVGSILWSGLLRGRGAILRTMNPENFNSGNLHITKNCWKQNISKKMLKAVVIFRNWPDAMFSSGSFLPSLHPRVFLCFFVSFAQTLLNLSFNTVINTREIVTLKTLLAF